jgi:myo-inositol-1(or 4)-monophosphatase
MTNELLTLATDAARAAATLLRDQRPSTLQIATKSTATDVVTDMDHAAERLLVQQLRAARPDDGFLGEEGADEQGTSGLTWVLDPIDGTVNYLYGIPGYAVSIGLRDGSGMVIGVVCNPMSGELWSAQRGQGAFLDGHPIRVNEPTDLAMALLATGFGYDAARRARQADVLRSVLPRVRDIRRFGAASLDLCAVACGRVDAYYERGLKPWDLAAGGLIAEEAGARVDGLAGRPAGEDLVIAAPQALFGPLAELLAANRAAED